MTFRWLNRRCFVHRSHSGFGKWSLLLYSELTVSFPIGRKGTVNFRNQCLWSVPVTLSGGRWYNNHVKDTQGHGYNHAMYDRGAWFLRLTIWSSRALWCLLSVKKQKHDFHLLFVQCKIKKISRFCCLLRMQAFCWIGRYLRLWWSEHYYGAIGKYGEHSRKLELPKAINHIA